MNVECGLHEILVGNSVAGSSDEPGQGAAQDHSEWCMVSYIKPLQNIFIGDMLESLIFM